MDGKFAPLPDKKAVASQWTHIEGCVSQILSTDESPPPAAQRSTNPYSILRSSGRLKIVVSTSTSGGGSNGATMSVARRLANDLLTYFKLDADIVPETEMEAQEETEIGNEGDTAVTVNFRLSLSLTQEQEQEQEQQGQEQEKGQGI